MTAPTTQAEQEDAVRESIACCLAQQDGWSDPYAPWTDNIGLIARGDPGSPVWLDYCEDADALLRGPIATLRTERDQLAADLRKAREALNFYADPDSWAGAPWRLDFQSPGRDGHGHEVAAAALTPDHNDAGGTAKGEDHV